MELTEGEVISGRQKTTRVTNDGQMVGKLQVGLSTLQHERGRAALLTKYVQENKLRCQSQHVNHYARNKGRSY